MKPKIDKTALLAAYESLPERYQPAWGLEETTAQACRACDDRLAVILPLLEALPAEGTLRILDVGCAQGYFSFAIADAFRRLGRPVQIVAVDYLADNIAFCKQLAAQYDLAVEFEQASVDPNFFAEAKHGDFDVVLALNVMHHVAQLQGNEAATNVLAGLRAHSRVLVCELAQAAEKLGWVEAELVEDAVMLSPYAFRRQLASFGTHLTEVPRPLYVCSDELAYVGPRWFAFDRVAEKSHAKVADYFAGQRRFFFGKDVLVKCYRGQGRYGDFNRRELENEVKVLRAISAESDRYPVVLEYVDDGTTVWLARTLLPGALLSEQLAKGDVACDTVLQGLLVELSNLEALGLYHDDLRCWNVLVGDGGIRLIDFGALSSTASPLQRVALAAVLLELATGEVGHEQPFYASLHPLGLYPPAWRALVQHLLGTAQAEFTFREARHRLEGGRTRNTRDSGKLCPHAEVVAAVARDQSEGFRRLREHADAVEDAIVKHDASWSAELASARDGAQRELVGWRTQAEQLASAGEAAQQALAAARKKFAELDTQKRAVQQALESAQRECAGLTDQLAANAQLLIEARGEMVLLHSNASRMELTLLENDARHAQDTAALRSTHAREAAALQADLAQARDQRTKLAASLDMTRQQHLHMQRRFRWFKWFWPKDSTQGSGPS